MPARSNMAGCTWLAAGFAAGVLLLAPASFADDLFVVTTTFEITGSASAMGLESPYTTNNDLVTIHSDAVVRRHDDHVFIVNRFLADNILVLDGGNNYAVVNQYSTGLNSNPYDFEVVTAGKAYIPRYESSELWVVEPFNGTLLDTVDLSPFADADGTPEMAQIGVANGRAFVAIQRLDRLQPLWPPLGDSGLAIIDIATNTLVDANPNNKVTDLIDLELDNPSGDVWYDRTLHRVLVVCSGEFLVLDGGLEAINPFTLQSDGVIVGEDELGGDLNHARIFSSTLGYALISDANFQTILVSFNPSTGQKLNTVVTSPGFDLSDIEISDAGRLYLSDRNPQNPGVRVFEAASGTQIGGPIGVGLPPFDMVVLDQGAHGPVTSAPSMRMRARLRAWPNPFNPQVSLELAGVGTAVPLRLLDVRGREVARLQPSPGGSERWLYRWNGVDDRGQPVASGVYHAIPADESAPGIRLNLIR